ncbi:MAG TPA: response regulator [Longimicrobiales bacterium]|jgi:CheY-like chemotaxis protein|nr:response regulator [Longimicrobiales bacterium]
MIVLLIDDEDAVRRVLARGLQRFGYTVEEVRSAAEARARLAGPARFDLVVTDVRLGDGFGTRAVADAVTPGRPPAVLVVSGTSDEEAMEAKALLPSWVRSAFLAKPFTLEELKGALGELMESELGGAQGG